MIPAKHFLRRYIILLRARRRRHRRTLRNLSSRHSNNYRLKHPRVRQMIRIARHVRVDRDRCLYCLVRCDDQSYSKREHTTS